jgi:hypothetical protein
VAVLVLAMTLAAAQPRSAYMGSPLVSSPPLVFTFFESFISIDLGDSTIGEVAEEDPVAESSAESPLDDLEETSQAREPGAREMRLAPRGPRTASAGSSNNCCGGSIDKGLTMIIGSSTEISLLWQTEVIFFTDLCTRQIRFLLTSRRWKERLEEHEKPEQWCDLL